MEHEHAASLTARAVKKALPDRAIVTREAQKTLNSATSVFTLYLASLAHETAVDNKRSTIMLKDVLQTLQDADFEHFLEPIEACVRETKAAANKKREHQEDMMEVEDGAETTSEVAAQLDEVAIDTNGEEEDAEEDGMPTDEPLDIDEHDSGDADESVANDAAQDKAAVGRVHGSQTAREGKTEDEDDEAMEQ
uniref:Transcription factor CBF/NF-Y/archaeal histone domain-containing protein n=1 Tax=Peronospora matthiolae TaxID=2874970 RepID=A0AAV1V299_9STRA